MNEKLKPEAGKIKAPKNQKKRILLADDHPMMRAGLAQLINKTQDLEVCFEAGSPPEALAFLSEINTDLIVTDLTMPGRSGIEWIKDLQAAFPRLPILVLSMHDELLYAERLLRSGARGYIMKEAGGEKIINAIRHILEGEVYVSERMSGQILKNLTAPKARHADSPIESLSDREFEVFRLLGQGKSSKEIGQELNISSKTVDVYRANIKEKLELKDAAALMHYAVRWLESQSSESGRI